MNQQQWQNFLAGKQQPLQTLTPEIAASWEFCRKAAVDPFMIKPHRIVTSSNLQVRQQQNRDLIKLIKQEIEKFSNRLQLRSPLMILTDNQGIILWRSGQENARLAANRIYFREGTSWTELDVGTNAIGIALRTKQAVSVDLAEHYAAASRHWSCAATPILDEQQQILGILDVSTFENSSAVEAGLLLELIAQSVANRFWQEYLEQQRDLLQYALQHPNQTDLLCDTRYRIVQVPPVLAEQFIVGQEMQQCLRPNQLYQAQKIILHEKIIGYQVRIAVPQQTSKSFYYPGINSQDLQYQEFLTQVIRAARSWLPIHIYGESGTGKEIIAKTIHYNSPAAAGPLIAVNCGAISENLLESELFGYAPGAFTGASAKGHQGKLEQANGGTLFLDEIDSMPRKMQTALLRVLEEKQVTPVNGHPQKLNFRLISASNQSLPALAAAGKFRTDLFYRIYVAPLKIPPLRQRSSDMQQLLEKFCQEQQWRPTWEKKILTVAHQYSWPGNIREFNNFLQRIQLYYPNQEPTIAQLQQLLDTLDAAISKPVTQIAVKCQRRRLPLTAAQIVTCLQKNHYHISHTAAELKISRTTLYRKMKQFGLR